MRMPKEEQKAWHGSKWIRPERRLAIHIRDGFSCTCCGRDLRNCAPGEMALDHLTPRSHGGGNESSNLVTICRSCNSSRGDRPWEEAYPGGAHDRVRMLVAAFVNLPLAKALIEGRAGDPQTEALR